MWVSRRYETLALFLVGFVCLAILLFTDTFDNLSGFLDEKSPPLQNEKLLASDTLDMPPVFFQEIPKCTENTSSANISGFSKLPDHIKDFLRYRHCRRFPILIDAPAKCGETPKDSSNVFLLLMIKSSPLNYDRREVIRKTWGRERLEDGVWIRRIFVSGVSGNAVDARRYGSLLEIESLEHKDILQFDFIDSFYNLTLKQILFLQWMELRCPHVHFLLNGDDDIFANTDNMVEFLKGLKENDGDKHLFTGHLISHVGPIREVHSKYYIPVQVQESNSYPPYCGGGGFLLSRFTAKTIHNMSHGIELLPIDDVYMGMCLEKAALKPTSHNGVKTAGLHVPSQTLDAFDPCYYRELLLVHRFLPHQTAVMWAKIHSRHVKCGISVTHKLPK
ncbi:N-acetyllactosaminide beta-1,3-N-acetylglucosaminyltransferase 3-like [Polypterus senegalus]|nr:N-acetyllactosaminide beta-1,3-N-acetylglucosaminyltransferase 3-like [Polypterus senegalus]XP_039623016.1 N-acetyllactosaminide beta-1,3-N-acetylglucosaminyltransferase 3-like [Polypterus senegalus]XP_039623017.1 N-acetyllactosaminide beta-1,3-N-acetylglucosaminyltransferase 3-like [Polypterus senegalus]XP_039623018.1 N-acetyllactosaminide beta-1,3-N-acetylglucosaminyltransferase 3-like [Polypterus senegalus]XP_039623019.1 N-acetyllactosaminide beta-1,3-N-acetylglucosaminyltransferase 3-lik